MKEAFNRTLYQHKLALAFAGSLAGFTTGIATAAAIDSHINSVDLTETYRVKAIKEHIGVKGLQFTANGLIIIGGLGAMSIISRKMDDWGWTPQSGFGSEDFQ